MPPKRRFLVVYEREDRKKQKLAVSIDHQATNDTLAREIAATVGEDAVRLEIGDGFELRGQDNVDTILESDIVTARPHKTLAAGHPNTPDATLAQAVVKLDQVSYQDFSEPTIGHDTSDGFGRFRVRLVTAELAHVHSKETPKDATEPTNGKLAFGGHFVSGNTTMSALMAEANKMFNWVSEDNTFDSNPCDHKETNPCSCGIAQEVEQHGLFSTLHCRLSIDGTRCEHAECPYSHEHVLTKSFGMRAPHCSICTDALGFPCPTCMDKVQKSGSEPGSVIYCPMVKNAGCGHLHHSHCIGSRLGSSSLGCPSGCSRVMFNREAVPFDQNGPCIIIVWGGDKIERIPVPSTYDPREPSMLRLSTEVILSLVHEFLRLKSLNLGELSVRMHDRDPSTETVSFTWTTLVSVCPTIIHKNEACYRFQLTETVSPSVNTVPRPMGALVIDFHTSTMPIEVCGCTTLKDVFPDLDGGGHDQNITLYVVKRTVTEEDAITSQPKRGRISKENTYLLDSAWQPSINQTRRGLAALLSSLYVLSSMTSKKGVAAENKVLAALYAVTRFPPAVRALGLLFLNTTLQPYEKAAISEALFHCLADFSASAPEAVVTNLNRRFETVRILLGHILTMTDSPITTLRPLESFSLACSISHKRLVDPVLLSSSAIVERNVGSHFLPGGLLYRPEHEVEIKSIDELPGEELRQVLSLTTSFHESEIYGLRLRDIPTVTRLTTLESAGRDFFLAIKRANETDLVSRGPLELKSPAVVPPHIVLDSEGFLAVFTGRGCGAARDVNFFRPTSGGDTEVDVNDVEYALQNVINTRKMENTWEIDCYGGITAKARPPDEAIVLCLDLSQSMNEISAVGDSGNNNLHQPFNYITEALKTVADIVEGLGPSAVLSQAQQYFTGQHSCCHIVWQTLVEEDDFLPTQLVYHLGEMALRDTYRSHLDGPIYQRKNTLLPMAAFADASRTQRVALINFVEDFLESFEPPPNIGIPPYDVPRRLVDPHTGDFIRGAGESPSAYWTAGDDLLADLQQGDCSEFVTITLQLRGNLLSWYIPPSTPTRTVYSLVNRATEAQYRAFSLRICASRNVFNDSTTTSIRSVGLGNGGAIEVCYTAIHFRRPQQINVKFRDCDETQTVYLPSDAPMLALISQIQPYLNGLRFSEIQLWHGLRDSGDGIRLGTMLQPRVPINRYTDVEVHAWRWTSTSDQRRREESRSLTRLELLKELFNVFLNRVSSFDTSVSLVLGLVTFSDKAKVNQELTPIFENFRLELEKVTANGNTAMYDALDLARTSLVNYGRDISNLRRRIIIVSDGEDTSSTLSIAEVGGALQRDNILVDSVQVGENHSAILHTFSAATGGYRFFPKTSLSDALSIFDLETIMYSAERPHRPRMANPYNLYRRTAAFLNLNYPIDPITIDNFPQRIQHPKLHERVRDVTVTKNPNAPNDDRLKRLMRELKDVAVHPHPQIDVYVNDEDISFLKVVIQAPDDDKCTWRGGCFLVTCDFPPAYPRDPPNIRFVTFILHPNISKQGKVCIAELSRLWSSDITLKELLSLVYGLLLEPDLDNPLEIQASLKYYDDDGTFALAAANAVEEHASKSRSTWREELNA